ncbi:MAG: hypothetical protein C4K49_03115 [Candidatus Thorarchaeota archaeon]|nr:MAG: hypothetical protein C4K49_03115 [Candidatus Thorarchaeota archaeon]
MAIDDRYESSVISYPTFTELNDLLRTSFEVLEGYMEYGVPTFVVRWLSGSVPSIREQEMQFNRIYELSDNLKLWPVIRWKSQSQGEYIIRFVPAQKASKSDVRINYALFVATIGTIAIGGFMQATSPVFLTLFYPGGWTFLDVAFVTVTFIASLMGIIFTHEMGHYLTARRRKIESTPPYFIPGLPQLGGTFGAFIQQKSPPKNRRDLFDLGVAGPLAGFAITLIVLVLGFFLSLPLTSEQIAALDTAYPEMTGSLAVPLVFVIMESVLGGEIPAGGTLYLHPIAFAGWVGCLVTALNLFPVSQLDGGHALRSLVGSRAHRYIGWGAIVVMALLGFFTMAILVLVLSQGGGHPGPLNDTVPISTARKALFVIAMIVLALAIPPLGLELF